MATLSSFNVAAGWDVRTSSDTFFPEDSHLMEIRTEVAIEASTETVWRCLTEDPDWGAWNPFIKRVEGVLAAGQKLKNTMEIPGQKPMTFKPTVLSAEPGKELRWKGRLLSSCLFS